MPGPQSNFDWIDTPNPTERAFGIVAKESVNDVTPDFLNSVITWAGCPDWVKRAEAVPPSLQGYTLVHCAKAGFQQRQFIFAKTRTEEERATAFKTRWVKRMHSWPTVLLKLWAQKGSLPLSSVDSKGGVKTTDRLHERTRYRNGGMFPTWFRIRHYLSERPFPRQSSQRVPITDSVHWSFDGFSGSFPDCLHPGVTVPNSENMGGTLFGFGTPSVEIGGDLVKQFFPPTLMQDWERYVLEDTRNEVFGTMEHRVLVECYPPIDDRENLG